MNSTNYTKGALYEAFVLRAHKLYQQDLRKGAEGKLFSNLLEAEEGNRYSFLPKYEEQFEKVKGYLEKACGAFLKNRKLTKEEQNKISELRSRFGNTRSAKEIYILIEEGIEITQPYREY